MIDKQRSFLYQEILQIETIPKEILELEQYGGENRKPIALFETFLDFFIPGFTQDEYKKLTSEGQTKIKKEINSKFIEILQLLQKQTQAFAKLKNASTYREQKKIFGQFLFNQLPSLFFPDGSSLNHAVLIQILTFFRKKMYDTLESADTPQGEWAIRYAKQNENITSRMRSIQDSFEVDSNGGSIDSNLQAAKERKASLTFKNAQVEEASGRYKTEISKLKTFRSQVQQVFEKSQKDQGNFSKVFLSYFDKINTLIFKMLRGIQ